MKIMQNPINLSDKPSTHKVDMPDYDWNKQTRHDTIEAGKHTMNSVQTFDNKGRPVDTRHDNSDS